ncbi:Asx homology domain-containing protein [Rhodocollybia butyracea]|uniref:Asx homology domain-containing protein n=1 Tax=Rhodocollybia butyracea TaxID=206335 RepID=A0A9P5Q769_9AGAR|nr:Asx homology domain-containing protein [Rhodocollybia butyracea]
MDRPKRTLRKPARLLEASAESTPSRSKRKVDEVVNDENTLQTLLKSPTSALTTMNISDLLNATTWEMLSPESREHLARLLPPTSFSDYKPMLDLDHPSRVIIADPNSMVIDDRESSLSSYSADKILLSVFTEPHFLAAAHTFQDHLYSGWLRDEFKAKVIHYQEGIRDGTLAAPWKDEEWEKDHPLVENDAIELESTSAQPKSRKTVKSGTADIRIYDLARKSVIQVGDIISYKRNFTVDHTVVEKDVLVHAINTRTRSITVLLESGPTPHLPLYLVTPDPPDPAPPMQLMDITSPTMLETGILDLDGRMERSRRPNGNAWKTFTVYRWREDGASSTDDNRGGRESHGTLHYLRNSYFSDP